VPLGDGVTPAAGDLLDKPAFTMWSLPLASQRLRLIVADDLVVLGARHVDLADMTALKFVFRRRE
jgi:hypothetical protein